jgi:hypothetical protein
MAYSFVRANGAAPKAGEAVRQYRDVPTAQGKCAPVAKGRMQVDLRAAADCRVNRLQLGDSLLSASRQQSSNSDGRAESGLSSIMPSGRKRTASRVA